MTEIVNLNRFRKARARADAQEQAAANRAKHGRTKAERARDTADATKRAALLDGAKRGGRDRTDPYGTDIGTPRTHRGEPPM
jgi:hypothetical protein